MVEPLPTDPSFGLPPEIPTGTSTPVSDGASAPTLPASIPKQTLIDVLGPESVSAPREIAAVSALTSTTIPKPTPAPAPAPEITMPKIEEAPFERAVPEKTIAFGIPAQQPSPRAPLKNTPQQPENTPAQTPPAPHTEEPSVPAQDTVSEAARRAAIRTLESDAAETIHQRNLSVSSIALAQQQSAEKIVRETLPNEERSRALPWILGGVGLAVLGAVVVTVAFLMQTQQSLSPTITVTAPDALIPGVEETTLDVTGMTRTKLAQTLSALPSAYAHKDGISLVRLITYVEQEDADGNTTRTAENVSPEDFFKTISARNTDRLERSLGALSYFGVVSQEGKASPFLAFEVTAYESAFAGLLEWESALPEDIAFMVRTPIPPPLPMPVLPPTPTSTASTTATSTPAQTATTTPVATSTLSSTKPAETTAPALLSSLTPVFKDLPVKNKDTRAFLASDGSIRVLYSFLSQKLLIIAPDEETLTALIDHISSARFSR